MAFKKNKKINKFNQEIEPHEIVLDKLAQKKELEFGISEKKFEVPLSQKKLKILLMFFLFLSFLLFGKALQIQIVEGKKLSELAARNKQRLSIAQPIRGVIYDSLLEQLVFNKSSYDLILDIKELPFLQKEKTQIISEISELIGLDYQEVTKKIKELPLDIVLVKENLDHETLVLLETKIKDFPGFRIQENTVREYKDGRFFSHLIGFTGKIESKEFKELENYSITDYIGKQGIEKSYEKILRGEPGRILIERDAFGKEISKSVFSESQVGQSLVLWLDAQFQRKITEVLQSGIERVGANRGAVIALDPKTGGVLAMVSLPDFDNNLFSRGINPEELKKLNEDPNNPLFNRIVSGTYLIGSTIKPLISAAVLQENVIPADKKILCQGGISIPNPYNPESPSTYLDWSTHGWTDLRKAIAVSCNVYFYTVGGGYGDIKGLGVERIKKYLELFGWGEKTGIDLPGEAIGLVPDPEWKENYFQDAQRKIWRVGDTYHMSIGQGDLAISPLQVSTAYVAIANGGTLYQPQVVKKIINGSANSSESVQELEPKIIRENFIDAENLKIIREGMREGVLYGSSLVLKDLPVEAAAKTGTAETPREETYHNWVTVFAPYNDPQIVLTVVIEDVKGVQFTALPVAKEVLNWYFSR